MITDTLLEHAAGRLRLQHVRPTHIRKFILSLFLESNHALSHADIEKEICHQFDRVTIYRTLNTFVEHQILHKIPGDNGVTRFATRTLPANNSDRDDHLHFKCNSCGHIYCIPEFNVHDIDMPKDFRFEKLVMSAEGICDQCEKCQTREHHRDKELNR